MTIHETLDILTPQVYEIHSMGCECPSCMDGIESVPLSLATSEDLARFILGKVSNGTYMSDHELRRLALDRVRKAREGAPSTPDNPCAAWASEGHKGHHWYLTASDYFVCACGTIYGKAT